MLRQQPGVQHIRVSEEQRGAIAQLAPQRCRGIAVIHPREHVAQPGGSQRRAAPAKLILAKRLAGKEQQRPLLRIAQQHLQQRRQVAERFPRRRAGDNQRMLPRPHGIQRLCLVRIEPADPARAQPILNRRCQRLTRLAIHRLPYRRLAHIGDLPGVVG